MWLKEVGSECCIDHEPLPANIQAMTPDICQEFARLFRQHCGAFVKNPRIMQLAEAKSMARVQRHINRCPCFFKKNIEIIRLDQRVNTRMEQLAYPRVRHLLLFKQQIRKVFPRDRILNINRLIRKSLFSLYSRLGNVQPPIEIKPVKKWAKSDWEKHNKILKKLAKHKKVRKPQQMPGKRRPLSEMKRYKYLAKPKKCLVIERAGWVFTAEIRNHRASERTKNLARPVIRDTTLLHQDLPVKIKPGVLQHKASERLNELSKPNARKSQSKPSDLKENPFTISPKALKAKASKRTTELAEPREYENVHIRADPYAISKAALKAKAKPRTIELAKPRKAT